MRAGECVKVLACMTWLHHTADGEIASRQLVKTAIAARLALIAI